MCRECIMLFFLQTYVVPFCEALQMCYHAFPSRCAVDIWPHLNTSKPNFHFGMIKCEIEHGWNAWFTISQFFTCHQDICDKEGRAVMSLLNSVVHFTVEIRFQPIKFGRMPVWKQKKNNSLHIMNNFECCAQNSRIDNSIKRQ